MHTLHAIDHAPYGSLHRRRRFMESHPLFIQEEELDRKYVYLYNNMSNFNAKTFLTHRMLRELQLIYNGQFHDVITNFVHFGYTAMTNLNSYTLKDPFNLPLSESMLNFLGRFCVRVKREFYFRMLTLLPRIGTKTTFLSTVVMRKIFSYVIPRNKFLLEEYTISLDYRKDCQDPPCRCFCHGYPEIRAVLSLMRIYDKTTHIEQDETFLVICL